MQNQGSEISGLVRLPEVRFNLKSTKDPHRKTLIVAVYRYRVSGKTIKFVYSTRIHIEPKHWNRKRGLPRPFDGDRYQFIKNGLTRISAAIEQAYLSEPDKTKLTKEEMRSRVDHELGRKKNSLDTESLIEFFGDYCVRRKNEPGANYQTYKKFPTTYNHLKAFAHERKGGNIRFDQVDFVLLEEFVFWLYAKPREHSMPTAAKHVKIVKQVLKDAYRRGFHKNESCFRKDNVVKVSRYQHKKVVLTFDELDILNALDLSHNPTYEHVRDSFVIGCFTGLRLSDFKRLERSHFIDEDGVQMIRLITNKTATEVFIPVMPQLRNILLKYDYQSPPQVSDQRTNVYLKEVCKIAGLNRICIYSYSKGGSVKKGKGPLWSLVSSHAARRSFASNFYELGLPASHLREITGHATEKQFFEYINLDKKRIAKQMAAKAVALMKNMST